MSRAIPVYRELLKAANKAFKSDNTMLSASRTEIRSHFEKSRFEKDPKTIDELLANGREASEFIRMHVVQGVSSNGGNFEVKLEPHHGDMVMSQEEEGECKSGTTVEPRKK